MQKHLERFVCEECDGEKYMKGGFTSIMECCRLCSGSGISTSKFMQWVNEQGLENIVMAVGIIEAIKVSESPETANAYLRSQGLDPDKITEEGMKRFNELQEKLKRESTPPLS